ncbi:hypothetical protein pv_36 [Pithovirus sibericum]|uniref:Uncharacterized protein n=1 Tax=Pithovirus sibericum TaxID=1450746 RepID=W5S4C6_9VIRU|nr:hypothetical protein pv_36 [Pithovirus sibericum]AHH01603.1 hypothetical protein pv_36 [Pithovirus sibericum]WIL05166.1 hypothetical protein pmam_127 [Pithovirus mammoth]
METNNIEEKVFSLLEETSPGERIIVLQKEKQRISLCRSEIPDYFSYVSFFDGHGEAAVVKKKKVIKHLRRFDNLEEFQLIIENE